MFLIVKRKMKSMKIKLLKKLKTIKIVGHNYNCKQERVLRLKASDGYVPVSPPSPEAAAASRPHAPLSPIHLQEEEEDPEPDIIEVSELMKDLEDEEMESLDEVDDKENISPVSAPKNSENLGTLEPKTESLDSNQEFRKGYSRFPPLSENLGTMKPKIESLDGNQEFGKGDSRFSPLSENLGTLNPKIEEFRKGDSRFSPFCENLVTLKPKINDLQRRDSNFFSPLSEIEVSRFNSEEEEEEEPPMKGRKFEGKTNPLLDFEEKCPPGGEDSVILYTTGLRGVRKTYEDCENTRFLLEKFRVMFFERDISMHSEFKDELWGILGQKVVPPRLFIKGRYIGGAERVFALHEQGKLKPLLEGIPLDDFKEPCGGCGGMRFILCFRCHGSRKIHVDDDDDENGDGDWKKKCPDCNENGLIVCPLCC